MDSKEKLIYILVCGLKKFRGSERCELAQLASLLAVQFGVEHPELLAGVITPTTPAGSGTILPVWLRELPVF